MDTCDKLRPHLMNKTLGWKVFLSFFVVGSLFLSLFTSSSNVKASGALEELEVIYHVYVEGERIGSIADKESFEQVADKKIAEVKDNYDDYDLVIGQDINLIPQFVFTARAQTEETMEKLDELLTVKAKATGLLISEKEVLAVASIDEAEKVEEEYILQFVSEDQWEAYLDQKEKNKDLETVPEVDETTIVDVRFTEEIQFVETEAYPEDILSVEDAVKKLNQGFLEEQLYSVQQGDVLGSIAMDHDLSTKELLELNPDIDENTLLQIDDELRVTAYEPFTKVIVTKMSTIEEDIPYQTETKDDDTMWRGDTKVSQEGKPGERIVSYELTKENNRTVERKIIEEEIIKEPVNKVILRGTKESPSRGTGNFSWPAVGGYVSSGYGMRWGRMHNGIDIARPSSYDILAADNGVVSFAGWKGGYGNTIKINHNNGYQTLYAHLASIDVSVGQTVGKGQKIGVMGSTGNSTGIHLHFEIHRNGQQQNPMNYLQR